MDLAEKATELERLHDRPELLVVVNVRDVMTAAVVAEQPGCTALATASYSISAAHGFPDGEKIPLDLMIDAVGRIAAAVDVPVSADLEAGYGDAGETIRRAIGVGVVGANIEDQVRPLAEAVAAVEAAVAAGAGPADEPTIARLVEGIGERKVSLISRPNLPPQSRLEELGVARLSFGGGIQRAVMPALATLAADLLGGGSLG